MAKGSYFSVHHKFFHFLNKVCEKRKKMFFTSQCVLPSLTCMSEVLALAEEALVPLWQNGEWLSRKIPGDALWTSSTRTAWRLRPRWIVCPSVPFLGDQKWRNRRERGLDCMEGDRQPPTWISAKVPWLWLHYEILHCRGAEWPHGWALVRTILCYTCNDIVTGLHILNSGSFLF